MAIVRGNVSEEEFRELRFQQETCCDSFDETASNCSTSCESSAISHLDSYSGQDEEKDVITLTIFDWDDTLFPTTWLQREGLVGDEVELQEDHLRLLKALASNVEKTLRLAMQFGRVVIVTNACQGWVEMCCEKMMPSLKEVVGELDIVSARSMYEACSDRPSEWKRLAFEYELRHSSSDLQYNVISLGDSLHEQRAIAALSQKMHNCFGKSMKFLEAPAIEQLIEQHDFAMSCFLEVAEHGGDLDVEIGI